MRFSTSLANVMLACILTAACALVSDANENFPFNSSAEGWTFGTILPASGTNTPAWDWYPAPSSSAGGLQARLVASGSAAGAWAMSPCLEVVQNSQQEYIHVDFEHFTAFPTGILGQVQFRIDLTGTGWGDWQGIPIADWITSNHLPPAEATVFPPLLTSQASPPNLWWAFSGTNNAATNQDAAAPGSGPHVRSAFDLPWAPYGLANGAEIQFRFLVGVDGTVPTQPETILWEVNQVQIDGVRVCVVPEPETLALAAVGGLGCLVFVGRRQRRSRSARKLSRSAAATILLAAAVAGLFAAAPAEAATSWNFQTNDGGWTRTSASPFVFPPDFRWTWTGTYSGTLPITGGTSPHWRVVAMGIQPPFSAGHFLTSPVFSGLSGTIPAQNARISIAHEFNYATGTSGLPINTGQLQYSVDGGPWLGLPLEAYTSGSSVLGIDPVFGPSPFASGTVPVFVDQTEFLAPTYLTPVGTGSLAYVSPGAAAFLGTSPGWPGDFYVPSQTFLNANFGLPSTGISSLQLRFTNLNRAGNCTDEGWNVRFVQVDFDTGIPPVPEPATIALGATALATVVAAGAIRRRGHQRASRPSERPWTTTLPAVSVAPRMGSSWHSWLTPYCSGARASPPSQKIA